MMWADALDEKVGFLNRMEPGVLLSLPGADEERDPLIAARKKIFSRIVDTCGVIATNTEDVGASLYITGVQHPVNEKTETNFQTLRNLKETPSGWALSMAPEWWRVARQLCLGLHYEWRVKPPDEWLNRRRDWARFVRETLGNSRTLDSELQVANACDDGKLDPYFLSAWREIKPTYTIEPKPVWHDDSALNFCQQWGEKGGIIWTDLNFFAQELAQRTGWTYYGENGLSRDKRFIEDSKESILIASVKANGTGRNLQRMNRCLITSMTPGAMDMEQLIGRLHRSGQLADEVVVDMLMTCVEHYDTWAKNIGEAYMAEELLGQRQKILMADVNLPAPGTGIRFKK